jgi:hypothetical protein
VSCFRFVDAEKASYPTPVLCKILRISSSGYYAWRNRSSSRRSREDAALTAKIWPDPRPEPRDLRLPESACRATGYGYPLRPQAREEADAQSAGLRGCPRGAEGDAPLVGTALRCPVPTPRIQSALTAGVRELIGSG